MAGGIYLIQDDGKLIEMTEQPYDSEELLQRLLADYPNLLAGDQIDSSAPRRWLLVCREIGVPAEEQGSDRWALDHLFLDQDAVPTLVEVKRSGDSRIRREVVGQMLDYAANGPAYWPVEEVRAKFGATCQARGIDVDQQLAEFLSPEADPEAFWEQVKTNLQAGKVRLLFVADAIPRELRRIVAFLNQQMDPAQVLAIEIKQYVNEESNLKALVPRVIGQIQRPQRPPGRQWDEDSFFRDAEARGGAVDVTRRIVEWAKSRGLKPVWGEGQQYASFYPALHHDGKVYKPLALWWNLVQIQFGQLQSRPPFDDEGKRRELLRRLNDIPGVSLPDDAITKWPSIRLIALKDEPALERFLAALDWVLDEAKAS